MRGVPARADRDGASLDAAEQRKLLENALRDFRLAGVSLPADRKQRFGQVMERLATAQAKFDENVLDATNAWSRHVADEAELAGLPANTVQRGRARRPKPPARPAGCCRSMRRTTRRS